MDFEKASIPCLFSHCALRFSRRSKTGFRLAASLIRASLSIFFTFVLSSRSLHAPFMVYSWCIHTLTTPKPLIFVKISPFLLGLPARGLIGHVLCVAGIHHGHSIAIYRVRKVPLIGISHMVSRPSRDGRLSTEESLLNLVNREDCIMCIAFHIVLIVSVAVFLRHILIERKYLARCPGLDDIVHVSLMHR